MMSRKNKFNGLVPRLRKHSYKTELSSITFIIIESCMRYAELLCSLAFRTVKVTLSDLRSNLTKIIFYFIYFFS